MSSVHLSIHSPHSLNISSETAGPISQISYGASMGWGTASGGLRHRVLKYYQVYSNDDPGLTLTYFTARSNLVPYAFVWEKGKTIYFSETIVL